MLKKLGKAVGKITLDICKSAANNAALGFGLGFGATAAICLAYGTYSWGKEVGHRQTIEEFAVKEEAACPEEAEVTANE